MAPHVGGEPRARILDVRYHRHAQNTTRKKKRKKIPPVVLGSDLWTRRNPHDATRRDAIPCYRFLQMQLITSLVIYAVACLFTFAHFVNLRLFNMLSNCNEELTDAKITFQIGWKSANNGSWRGARNKFRNLWINIDTVFMKKLKRTMADE